METLIWFKANGLEHCRPVDSMGLQDVLCDDMFGYPPIKTKVFRVRIPYSGEVVYEGVEPYIGNKFIIKREGNSPVQAAFRPGNA